MNDPIITDAMLNAGLDEYFACNHAEDSPWEIVAAIYSSMSTASVTDEMVTAAIRAFRPYLDDEGHLTCLNVRDAVKAGLLAALEVRSTSPSADA